MKNNKYLNFYIVVVCLVILATTTHVANAQWKLPVNNFNLIDDLDLAIANLTKWLLGFTVGISVLTLIWGGVNYIFSSGDAQKADLSKKIIYYSLIGLFVAGIAFAIVHAIVTKILVP